MNARFGKYGRVHCVHRTDGLAYSMACGTWLSRDAAIRKTNDPVTCKACLREAQKAARREARG